MGIGQRMLSYISAFNTYIQRRFADSASSGLKLNKTISTQKYIRWITVMRFDVSDFIVKKFPGVFKLIFPSI